MPNIANLIPKIAFEILNGLITKDMRDHIVRKSCLYARKNDQNFGV